MVKNGCLLIFGIIRKQQESPLGETTMQTRNQRREWICGLLDMLLASRLRAVSPGRLAKDLWAPEFIGTLI